MSMRGSGLAPVVFAVVLAAVPARGQPAAARPDGGAPAQESTLGRWLEVPAATFGGRFRYQETAAGRVSARQLQYSGLASVRLKLDPKSRVTVTALAQTGTTFTGSWNATGVGTGDFAHDAAVRQLFVTVAPVPWLQVSAGSLPLVRGVSSEVTSYDNDGYLTGERLVVRRRQALWFDEVAVTSARLGEISTPSAWTRLSHFARDRNYAQLSGTRTLGRGLTASLDLTRADGRTVLRAAVQARTARVRLIDNIRVEEYTRLGDGGASGFACSGDKTLARRLTVSLGLQRIDAAYPPMNGDRYGRGTRLFGLAGVRLTPDLTLQVFAADRAFGDRTSAMRRRLDVALQYNAAAALKRAGVLP